MLCCDCYWCAVLCCAVTATGVPCLYCSCHCVLCYAILCHAVTAACYSPQAARRRLVEPKNVVSNNATYHRVSLVVCTCMPDLVVCPFHCCPPCCLPLSLLPLCCLPLAIASLARNQQIASRLSLATCSQLCFSHPLPLAVVPLASLARISISLSASLHSSISTLQLYFAAVLCICTSHLYLASLSRCLPFSLSALVVCLSQCCPVAFSRLLPRPIGSGKSVAVRCNRSSIVGLTCLSGRSKYRGTRSQYATKLGPKSRSAT